MEWWTGMRIEPDAHRFRWYTIALQPTLWPTWEGWTMWGRLGLHVRGRQLLFEGTREDALHAVSRRRQRKEQRGYQTM